MDTFATTKAKVCNVPKAPIAGADINGCYLEADIKIQTSNAYLVPSIDWQTEIECPLPGSAVHFPASYSSVLRHMTAIAI